MFLIISEIYLFLFRTHVIISYTSGISVQGGIWFCGLRDSKVEPRKWYEKYGIDDYVYYTIRLEEDKPSSKGTVYVKISK